MSDIPEPRLTPDEKEPAYVCSVCGAELYNDDYAYNGAVLCEECYSEIRKPETVIKFIQSYPQYFIEYLEESIPEKQIADMLEDYRKWRSEDYDNWVVGN